jgi:hypothetical protein
MTARNDMALFRRPKDNGDDAEWVPSDDMGDFHVSKRQQQIHRAAETRRHMVKLWAQIEERWRNPWRQA